MKILLINPSLTAHISDIPSPEPPLGLAYIAAILEENNYEVKILDALALGSENIVEKESFVHVGLDEKDIRKYIKNFSPQIVGISAAYTAYSTDSHNCAQIVKNELPNSLVVFGGAHTSASPDVVLIDNNIDIAVKGEGETTFLEIVKNYENKTSLSNIPGTVVKKGSKIHINPSRPYISNLDSLPFPARHLLPMEKYLNKPSYLQDYSMRQPRTNMITSRGCPYSCVFCSIHSVWGRQWRPRSPKKVVDEIEYMKNTYGVKEIAFLDDNISFDKKRMIQICDELIKRKLDIKWCTPNGVYIKSIDLPLLKKMKDSGCWKLTFGIESGSIDTQKFIGKVWNLDQCSKIIKQASSLGIWTHSTFMIGFPYETIESYQMTVQYAIKSDLDFANFYIATPYSGTKLKNIFLKEKMLSKDNSSYKSINLPECDTKFFTRSELLEMQSNAYSKFIRSRILRPFRILKKIKSFEDIKFTIKIARIATSVSLTTKKSGSVQTHFKR